MGPLLAIGYVVIIPPSRQLLQLNLSEVVLVSQS